VILKCTHGMYFYVFVHVHMWKCTWGGGGCVGICMDVEGWVVCLHGDLPSHSRNLVLQRKGH